MKIFKILTTVLFAMAATTFAACDKDDDHKKDDQSMSVEFERSAVFFDYGQNQFIALEKSNVMSLTPTTPEGWAVAIVDGGLSVTAPQRGVSDAEYSAKITVTAKNAAGDSKSATVIVAVRPVTDLSAGGTANSYVVCDADSRYSFRATTKGNGSESIAPTKAGIVWQTEKDLVQYVEYADGAIYFNTTYDAETLTAGNALLAAMDDDDNILWSWHIWVTPTDPREEVDTYADGSQAMSRNLGALSSYFDTDADTIYCTYGLMYQWGRKDPFVGGRDATSSINDVMYNAEGKGVNITYTATSAETGTPAYASAHPLEFIKGTAESGYDWLFASRDNSLWGIAKTVNDPCPAGWRVAPKSLWAGFTSTGAASTERSEFNVTDDFYYGWKFDYSGAESSFYPAAGRRSFANGTIANTDSAGQIGVGFYWSCQPSAEAGYSAALSFTSSSVNPADSRQRANAFSVRCVRE